MLLARRPDDVGRRPRDAHRCRRTGGAVSSAVLYLAIVALWAVVLVPMWLRRDTDTARPGLSWLPHRRPTQLPEHSAAEPTAPEPAVPGTVTDNTVTDNTVAEYVVAEHAEEAPLPRPRQRRSRGAVMARRRRRTGGLSLLALATVGCALGGLVPYWAALPPAGLLAGHLSLLRVAAGIDAARREAIEVARAAERAAVRAALAAKEAAKEAAEEAAQAQIIDLMARNRARGVFDQYAVEGLRVVGD